MQDLLLRHPWPGNVRQMHSVIQVALALCDGDQLEVGDLPQEFLEGLAVDMGELLQATDGNISQLAKRLGVSRNTVYKRLREGGL